ncbi:hypothetical protein K504DRAFT_367414 [Pleomassaria siparia CBS 279.74]|uniref:Uncharacterized protein n=1 Tax=Pleomassaria siparia CBS 279.74 TaxID=1314801 RepID=A0A6G1KR17_9PLEO|nr:hypothetical protein K504DRAFT_367414 [Pleomassaria siparia CBS 279.74]
MANTLAAASITILYCLSWPLLQSFYAVSFILTPLWTCVQFILLPITCLAHAVLDVVLFPFRLRVLDRIETIYIYLGIAALIGCIAGAVLHFSFTFISSTLSIDAASESRARSRQRTAATYRAARSKRKAEILDYASTRTMVKTVSNSQRQRGLLSQTIIEEQDSDF